MQMLNYLYTVFQVEGNLFFSDSSNPDCLFDHVLEQTFKNTLEHIFYVASFGCYTTKRQTDTFIFQSECSLYRTIITQV